MPHIHTAVATQAKQILVTADVLDGPVPLSETSLYFHNARIEAIKSLNGLAADGDRLNAGNVAIGRSDEADKQPIQLQPGDVKSIGATDGSKWNFQDWYLVVAADGDGVVIIYD